MDRSERVERAAALIILLRRSTKRTGRCPAKSTIEEWIEDINYATQALKAASIPVDAQIIIEMLEGEE